jgi:hypothetical protein
MCHDDKTIRAAAKSIFIKLAPEDAKQAVKDNWKASYRTEKNYRGFADGDISTRYIPQYEVLGILGKALCLTSVNPVGQFIKVLGDRNSDARSSVAGALGEMGDVRAVAPLIKVLEEDEDVSWAAARALGKIGDVRAVAPLIKALGDSLPPLPENDSGWLQLRPDWVLEDEEVYEAAAGALGEIGDARAVEPLIEMREDLWARMEFAREYFDEEDWDDHGQEENNHLLWRSTVIKETLEKLGHKMDKQSKKVWRDIRKMWD